MGLEGGDRGRTVGMRGERGGKRGVGEGKGLVVSRGVEETERRLGPETDRDGREGEGLEKEGLQAGNVYKSDIFFRLNQNPI